MTVYIIPTKNKSEKKIVSAYGKPIFFDQEKDDVFMIDNKITLK